MVVDLINQYLNCWKEDVIDRIFTSEEAMTIKCIPLSRSVKEDMLVWKGDNSGEYYVCSGYRSLLDQQITNNNLQQQNNFYKNLWSLDIPSKIKISIWRLNNNWVPTLSVLYNPRIATSPVCPRCGLVPKTVLHVLLYCGLAHEV